MIFFDKKQPLNLGTLSYSKNWNIFTKESPNRILKHHFPPFCKLFRYIYISKLPTDLRFHASAAPNIKFFLHSNFLVCWATHHMVSRISNLNFHPFLFQPDCFDHKNDGNWLQKLMKIRIGNLWNYVVSKSIFSR